MTLPARSWRTDAWSGIRSRQLVFYFPTLIIQQNPFNFIEKNNFIASK